MNHSRRTLLQRGGVLAALVASGLLSLEQACAAEAAGFEAKTLKDAFAAMGGQPADSKDITLTSPDIAENGAVVPIAVTSAIAKTEAIYVFVEKNPFPLTATFVIPEGTDAYVATRAKLGESSNIYAVVKADGKLYSTAKETKVTLGGCGG